MANELKFFQKSGLTNVTARLHVNGGFFAASVMTENLPGSPRSYSGDMPVSANGVPGEYNVAYIANTGLANEKLVAGCTILWDGTQVVDALDINSTLTGSDAGRLL